MSEGELERMVDALGSNGIPRFIAAQEDTRIVIARRTANQEYEIVGSFNGHLPRLRVSGHDVRIAYDDFGTIYAASMGPYRFGEPKPLFNAWDLSVPFEDPKHRSVVAMEWTGNDELTVVMQQSVEQQPVPVEVYKIWLNKDTKPIRSTSIAPLVPFDSLISKSGKALLPVESTTRTDYPIQAEYMDNNGNIVMHKLERYPVICPCGQHCAAIHENVVWVNLSTGERAYFPLKPQWKPDTFSVSPDCGRIVALGNKGTELADIDILHHTVQYKPLNHRISSFKLDWIDPDSFVYTAGNSVTKYNLQTGTYKPLLHLLRGVLDVRVVQ
jgi:hypothetical protein